MTKIAMTPVLITDDPLASRQSALGDPETGRLVPGKALVCLSKTNTNKDGAVLAVAEAMIECVSDGASSGSVVYRNIQLKLTEIFPCEERYWIHDPANFVRLLDEIR